MNPTLERRAAAGLEYRFDSGTDLRVDTDEDALTAQFAGYAATYDVEYDVFGGPDAGGWTEVVRAGAGAATLADSLLDVRLLVDHAGRPLARSSRGTLRLAEDRHGLLAEAPHLDMRMPSVQDVVYPLQRGDLDQMSFAFRVRDQKWHNNATLREIRSYDLAVKGADVSIVTYPANDATLAVIRAASGVDQVRAALRSGGMDVRLARVIADRLREAQPALIPH